MRINIKIIDNLPKEAYNEDAKRIKRINWRYQ